MANRRQNISFPEETRAQIDALAPLFGKNISEVVRTAVDEMYQRHFPTAYPDPYVVEYRLVRLPHAATCEEAGAEIPAGTDCWRVVWSFGEGGVVSQAGMDAATCAAE